MIVCHFPSFCINHHLKEARAVLPVPMASSIATGDLELSCLCCPSAQIPGCTTVMLVWCLARARQDCHPSYTHSPQPSFSILKPFYSEMDRISPSGPDKSRSALRCPLSSQPLSSWDCRHSPCSQGLFVLIFSFGFFSSESVLLASQLTGFSSEYQPNQAL